MATNEKIKSLIKQAIVKNKNQYCLIIGEGPTKVEVKGSTIKGIIQLLEKSYKLAVMMNKTPKQIKEEELLVKNNPNNVKGLGGLKG